MYVATFWPAVLGALVASASAKPAVRARSTLSRRAPEGPQFVSTENGKFVVNGERLNFVGTNAYWLHTLNTEADINKTLADIAAAGIRVVRTWAFNDVEEIPEAGTWFQQIKDGQLFINEGANGLQKLDTVVRLAEENGIYLQMALTNNWSPRSAPPTGNATTPQNLNLPRNVLSNDYGGMDVYVRQFGLEHHDQFYTNQTLIDGFKAYTAKVVKRYCKSPAIFGWEIANDPRCNSTLPAGGCKATDVTRWHAEIASHIRDFDTNHLISSGNGGYFCVDCPKLFPRLPPPAPPQASPAPGAPRRRAPKFLTRATLLQKRREGQKARRNAAPQPAATGRSIRGRWAPTATRRQADIQAVGPAYDGSYGVDSQDIVNIPDMDFGSFQLFPDQQSYGVDDPGLSSFQNMVNQGNEWIQQHGETSADFGKPVTLNGFGLVTQDNAASFAPFNGAPAPSGPDLPGAQAPYGVTNDQRTEAYQSWINTGLQSDLRSMVQYQWGQPGLSVAPGTTVSTATGSTGVGESTGSTGVSPNDGYAINDVGRPDVIQTIQQGQQSFGSDAFLRR